MTELVTTPLVTTELVTWDRPMHTSRRIYHRGSIKLPNNPLVDIMLIGNNTSDYQKIGTARLIENENGLWASNIEYLIDDEYLSKMQEDYLSEYIKENPNDKVFNGLAIGCTGIPRDIYTGEDEENSVEFKFLHRHILTYDIKGVMRDMNLNKLLSDV
jgi:hypothetical protein